MSPGGVTLHDVTLTQDHWHHEVIIDVSLHKYLGFELILILT